MVSNASKLWIVSVLGIAAYTSVTFGSELIRRPVMSVSDAVNGLLALTVAIFTIVQGMATFTQSETQNNQFEMQKNANQIEDARNELEKAYGQLYSLLNSPLNATEGTLSFNEEQKVKIDYLFAAYPFMYNPALYEEWKTSIKPIQRTINHTESLSGVRIGLYHLPPTFRDAVNSAYEAKLGPTKNYWKGKKLQAHRVKNIFLSL